jgi:hypothetical protein
MAVGDVTKIALIHSLTGADGDIIVTHHFRKVSEPAPISEAADLELLLDTWQSNVQAEWLAALSDRVVLQTVQARSITHPLFGSDRAVGLPGDLAPIGLGNTSYRVAPVVSLRTANIGRSYRGRNFLPPPNETDIENGALEAPLIALIQAYYTDVIGIGDGNIPIQNSWSMTIYSPTLSAATSTVVDTPVTSFQVRSIAGTQRGRQRVS